jgi:hypothetical protein
MLWGLPKEFEPMKMAIESSGLKLMTELVKGRLCGNNQPTPKWTFHVTLRQTAGYADQPTNQPTNQSDN